MALTTTQPRDSADATMSTAIRSESDQPTTMRPFKPITVKGHSTPLAGPQIRNVVHELVGGNGAGEVAPGRAGKGMRTNSWTESVQLGVEWEG